MTPPSKVMHDGSRLPAREPNSTESRANVRVLIADGETLLRQCLAVALAHQPMLRVVAEAGTAGEALELARSRHPEVVVLDTELPGGGLALIGHILAEAPDTGILVLTNDNSASASQVLHVGARGYLDKKCDLRDVARAIERVSSGDIVVMAGPAHGRPDHGLEPLGSVERMLTPRELEVLHLVVQGHTNAQIAECLCITAHTVKGHLAKILHKLELDNRVQLTAYAAQRGLAQLIREPVRPPKALEAVSAD